MYTLVIVSLFPKSWDVPFTISSWLDTRYFKNAMMDDLLVLLIAISWWLELLVWGICWWNLHCNLDDYGVDYRDIHTIDHHICIQEMILHVSKASILDSDAWQRPGISRSFLTARHDQIWNKCCMSRSCTFLMGVHCLPGYFSRNDSIIRRRCSSLLALVSNDVHKSHLQPFGWTWIAA